MPSSPDPRRLRPLIESALALPPADRDAHVRHEASDDHALRDAALETLKDEGVTQATITGVDLTSASSDKVQSSATDELMDRLEESPKLDVERYEFQGEVDRGGMGAILKIHDRHLNRRLAMKVLLDREPPQDEFEEKLAHQLLGRFLEEAQVTSQLDHPGVVPVHELGLDQNGKAFFTMRLIRGRTAGAVFREVHDGGDDWTVTRALEVILKVCDTIAFAHSKGILHRDLKPENVMVGRFGEVYVMDWGLAKVLGQPDPRDLRIQPEDASAISLVDSARGRDAHEEAGSSVVSMDGQKLGTPSYMSPEQARSEDLDPRTDVYSIGAMLYELLAGRAPYTTPGVRKYAYRILEDVADGPPKRIEDIERDVPAELVAIVERAMERDREQRYGNVTALASDLRAYLDQRAVQAHRTGAVVELKLWVRRNKPLAASLAAAVLAIVVGMIAFGLKTREANAATLEAKTQAARSSQLAAAEAAAKQEALNEKQRATKLRDDALARSDALWTIQELAEFQRKSSDLEFAYALERPGVEWWLETAHRLVDGHPADKAAGTRRRPGLADHQRLLTEIRSFAAPPTSAELDPEGQQVGWSFNDREKRWWNEQLTGLEADLLELRDLLTLAERCATSPEAQTLWAEARTAIQSHPSYDGLELGPQLFLLPLGADPDSGLWEFAHLLTGEPAVRGTNGKLDLTGETGLLFVLLPGGRVPVEDGAAPGPLNEVDLAPFLLSKYEMTRGQWSRMSTGWTGRFFGGSSPLHPANSVSWDDCQACLGALPSWVGLPSEAQWEYGCRAGRATPWWPGADKALLRGAANVDFNPSDSYCKLEAVGTLKANPFGLHDVHGNLCEWCQDPYESDLPPRPMDGLRYQLGATYRVYRGGSFTVAASLARSRYCHGNTPGSRNLNFGLRPCQGITP